MRASMSTPKRQDIIVASSDEKIMLAIRCQGHCKDLSLVGLPAFGLGKVIVESLS